MCYKGYKCLKIRFNKGIFVILWNKNSKKYDRFLCPGKSIGESSHLQQGIERIETYEGVLKIEEVPHIYPSERVLKEKPHYTGPMAGNDLILLEH